MADTDANAAQKDIATCGTPQVSAVISGDIKGDRKSCLLYKRSEFVHGGLAQGATSPEYVPSSLLNGHESAAMTADNRRGVQIAGTKLGKRAHICAFFSNADDEYEVLLPFIREGFEMGEKACHTLDPQRCGEHLSRLSTAEIDCQSLQSTGQFELRSWNDAHLCEPHLDSPRTLAFWEAVANTGRTQGFPLTRFITHMEWFFESSMNANDLLEYEARANDIWIGREGVVNPVVCIYDLKRFSGEIVINVIRTHPLVVIGGILQENPFFVYPEEFLRTLHKKR